MTDAAFSDVAQATGPYPGLRPFRHDETEIFFGREEQTDQLLERLQHSHFIAVVGPSGCGKSSLVRAGLIAALQTGFLSNAGAGWRVAEMRPGDQPLPRLAEALLAPSALGPEQGTDADQHAIVQAMLRRGPLGLIEILREARLPQNENLLVLVDQFEEIFRFRTQGTADEADALVALLLASAAQRELPVYVILTMRSDFLGDCALFSGLPEAINDSQYLTPRLSRDQIRAAIVGPAHVFGGDIEPALVNRLLNEIGPDPDQLPLLQHALMRMWARVAGGQGSSIDAPIGNHRSAIVTMADYDAVGALSEALSSHADQVLAGLSERQQNIVRVMLSRLTERGVGKRDTRRPARLDDVAAVAGVSVEDVRGVVEQLRQQDRSFLTPPPPVPLTADTMLDIGHESLIRQWHQLYDWVEAESASAAVYRRLLQTAHLWADGKAALWSSPDLDEALKWRRERDPSKPWALRYGSGEEFDLALKFVGASEERAEHLSRQAVAAEEARRAQEEREQSLQLQATRARRILWVSAVLMLCVLGTSAMAWWAFRSRAEARTLSLEAQKQTAYAKASEAEAKLQRETAENLKLAAEEAKLAAVAQKARAEQAAGVAQKQRAIAEDLGQKSRSREIATNATQQLQVDPELGLLLALEARRVASTPQAEGVLQQAVLANKLRGRISLQSGSSAVVRLTPDGNFALTWDRSRSGSRVQIHNVTAGGPPTVIESHGPDSLIQLNPDGKSVIVPDSAAAVRVWEIATAKPIAGPLSLDGPLTYAFFAPQGDVLGLMTAADKPGLWETRTWRPLSTITRPLTRRVSPALSYDSKYLLAMEPDRTWRILDTATGQEIGMVGDRMGTVDASFSPDGRFIVTTSSDRTASLWSVRSGEWGRVGQVGDQLRPVDRAEFNSHSTLLLTSARDNFVRVWAVGNPQEVEDLAHPDKEAIQIASFSPDGKSILTVENGGVGTLRVWRGPFSRRRVGDPPRQSRELKGHAGAARSARFSPDSRWIVSTGVDGTAKLWDTTTAQLVASFSGGSISEASLSKDSRRLFTTSRDGTVRIWDTLEFGSAIGLAGLADGEERPLKLGTDASAMTRNGEFVAAIASDGFARIWETATGRVKVKLGEGEHKAKRVLLSRDGKRAITTGTDNTARLWDVDTGESLASFKPREGTPPGSELILGSFSDASHPWTWYKGGFIEVWSLKDGKLSAMSSLPAPPTLKCVTVSPDVSWLVLCEQRAEPTESAQTSGSGLSNIIQVRQLPSGAEVQVLRGHTGEIVDVFFSRDGQLAVSTSRDKTARIWDVGSWRLLATLAGHDASVTDALFTADTRYVATIANEKARVSDTATGKLISELRGHTDLIVALAFSANGRWLATGSRDNTARVWDTTTGKAVAELYGHTGPVIAVAFSQDPKVIVTASVDGTVRRYRCGACIPVPELLAIAQQRLKAIGRPALTPSEQEALLR